MNDNGDREEKREKLFLKYYFTRPRKLWRFYRYFKNKQGIACYIVLSLTIFIALCFIVSFSLLVADVDYIHFEYDLRIYTIELWEVNFWVSISSIIYLLLIIPFPLIILIDNLEDEDKFIYPVDFLYYECYRVPFDHETRIYEWKVNRRFYMEWGDKFMRSRKMDLSFKEYLSKNAKEAERDKVYNYTVSPSRPKNGAGDRSEGLHLAGKNRYIYRRINEGGSL